MNEIKKDKTPTKTLYAAFLFVCLIAAVFAMSATQMGLGGWGKGVLVPSWAPSIFGLTFLWIINFLLLAICGAHLWQQSPSSNRVTALLFWILDITTTILWFYLFFIVHTLVGALIAAALLLIWAILLLRHGKMVHQRVGFYLFINLVWVFYHFLMSSAIFLLTVIM